MSTISEVLTRSSVPKADLEALRRERDELTRHLGSLLPIETELRRHIEGRLYAIGGEAAGFLGAHENQTEPLPVVDLSVLGWRHTGMGAPHRLGIALPKLALVNIKGTSMTIPFPQGDPTPDGLKVLYHDVARACDSKNRRATSRRTGISNSRITFTYQGAIPSEQRDLITKSRPQFEEVFLLVDAPAESWQFISSKEPKLERPPRTWDPLIVGWRHGHLYLLGQFDPTPVEKYVELEFTYRPALNAGQR